MRKGTPRRLLSWLAVLQILVFCFTVISPLTAAAQTSPEDGIPLLTHYQIVRGDNTGNLNLDKPITRAEMITIMVRAMGGEQDANLFKGYGFFKDTQGHWADGYINYAALKGLVKGDGNGFVRPQDQISWGESLTLLVRLIEREPKTGTWPVNVLVAASELGILPSGLTASTIGASATRGPVFESLAKAVTTVPAKNGKTYLQAYVDSTPPTIDATVSAQSTKEATVVVSGTVQDAHRLSINGKPVTFSGSSFSSSVSLSYGPNSIVIEATDRAGNSNSREFSVTRMPPVASLQVEGPAKVAPGSTAMYKVTAFDESGKVVDTSGLSTQVEGPIGAFDLATSKLTAANTPGKGKITFTIGSVSSSVNVEILGPAASAQRLSIRSINSGLAVPFTKTMTIEVEVQDIDGQLLPEDYGRPVTLSVSGIAGLAVTPLTANTVAGVAKFSVQSSTMGDLSVIASSAGLVSDVRNAKFGSNLRVRLTASPASITIGSNETVSQIRAELLNENGSPVTNNLGTEIAIQLAYTGTAGTLTQSYLRIPNGASTSVSGGFTGQFQGGPLAGVATITGTVTSGQNLTIDPVAVTAILPTIGSGSRWDMIGLQPQQKNVQGSFVVRLTNSSGTPIPGSFSFQIAVDTTNGEAKTNGIPAGVELWIGDTPVTSTATILRTTGGTAAIKMRYDKAGQVKLTITSAATTTTALGSDGLLAAATNPSIGSSAFDINYTGTFSAVQVKATSDAFGIDKATGATSTGAARAVTLAAYVSEGLNWIPLTSGTAELLKDSGTSFSSPSVATVTFTNGKATFSLAPTSTAGSDTYRVRITVGNTTLTSSPIQVYNHSAASPAPTILAIRGNQSGTPGALDYLAPTDTHMEIELAQEQTQNWVVVRVFAENQSTALFVSDPIDISSVAPMVVIPKSALPNGITRYQVSVRNGFGDSPRSSASNQVTNAVYVTNVTATNARYSWTNQHLTIYGSGFSTGSTINPALITLRNGATQRTLTGATVVSVNNGQIVLNLTSAASLSDIEDAALFRGSDVRLTMAAGWLTRTNGEQSAAISTVIPVSPMADITHVEYDHVNSRLILHGSGFSRVTLDFTKLVLQTGGQPDIALSGFSNTRLSDTRWQVSLSNSAVTLLNQHSSYVLNGSIGWAHDSNVTQKAFSGRSIYGTVALSSVTYNSGTGVVTITGSGFTGGAVTVANLSAINLANNNLERTLAGSATIVNDTTITIELSPDALGVQADFFGNQVYLLGQQGWFTNAAGRASAPIPNRTLRFPTFPNP